jgi:hypothetical protein
LISALEKERMLNEDPKWNDTNYVLINYKTEQCKRPPRLCRQGFACPQFHNARDRRRNPSIFKYRSTPCPQVKQGDDWLEPSVCEQADLCKYCHSRTEQQFHPEIYKSSKCNVKNYFYPTLKEDKQTFRFIVAFSKIKFGHHYFTPIHYIKKKMKKNTCFGLFYLRCFN